MVISRWKFRIDTSDWPWRSSDNTSKAIASTHNLPPQQMAFASTTKGICLHTKQWHLHPQRKAFASTPNGIRQHNQRHLPTHSKAYAPTTKLASLQENLASCAAKSPKMKVRLDLPVSMLLPLETLCHDLRWSAIDVLEIECNSRLFSLTVS